MKKQKLERILYDVYELSEINEGVVALVKKMGISGSSGDFNLYQLLQCYFQSSDGRSKMNEVARKWCEEHMGGSSA